ncbi:MAG: bifunctional 4-hydroxy-2-oxoglutarate aldolase/2-dehydro-3-deoxy-phosphogluconate aldolase, partial [Micromonosporaceae bacterium]|nr:bifunctional 4-hydroxy-2-oxoglutarate aldolase/2-dehydro-3-deoxy-phosphogluconate aldolase [Micromonosporaceae bacterium]
RTTADDVSGSGPDYRSGVDARQVIESNGLVAILRGVPPAAVLATGRALVNGGVRALEVTFDAPFEPNADTLAAIETLVSEHGDTVCVGAGTVLSVRQVQAAAGAGARFIVSPNVNIEVVTATRRLGLASIPGAMTPSECLTAFEAGASMVKLFPVSVLSPAYIRAVRSPLPWLPLVAVGGVNLHNAKQWIEAGANAVGVGGELVSPHALAHGDYAAIATIARQLTDLVAEAKSA